MLACYATVQEGLGNPSWSASGVGILGGYYQSGSPSILKANHTLFSVPAGDLAHLGTAFVGEGGYLNVTAKHCEFSSGRTDAFGEILYHNCLFDRSSAELWGNDPDTFLILTNCTMRGGLFAVWYMRDWPMSIVNSAFDGTTIQDSYSGWPDGLECQYRDYNAFLPVGERFCIGGAHDVLVPGTFDWQVGPLGSFYLPADSDLIDAGSSSASEAELDDYTTDANQTPDIDDVDIGFHYPIISAPLTCTDDQTLCPNATLSLCGSDLAGLPLAFLVVTPPTHGSLGYDAYGTLVYTPNQCTGSDTFTYKVNNGFLDSAPDSVTVTIADTLAAYETTVETCKNTPKSFNVSGSGSCGLALTYAKVSGSGPNHAQTFSFSSSGAVNYTPADNYCGDDSFQFVAINSCGQASPPATVTIKVGDPSPDAHCQDVMTGTGIPVTFTLAGADDCGDTLEFAVVPDYGPNHGTLSGFTRNNSTQVSVMYTPAESYEGPDGFYFTVNNCGYTSPWAYVTVNVVPGPAPTTECLPHSIVLRWTLPEWLEQMAQSSDYIKDFRIYRCVSSSGGCSPDVLYSTVDSPAILDDPQQWVYVDTDVVANTTYCYRVTFRHENSCNVETIYESPFSTVQCSTTCCPDPQGSFWTDYGGTPQQLAEWIIGPGVTVSNAKYTGAAEAKGIFGGASSVGLSGHQFPMNHGVILSSGAISNARGLNNNSHIGSPFELPGDPDLDNLVGEGGTDDAAVLEFDFIAASPFTLQIEYVYASDEYPEYVGRQFVDPFAIFITTSRIGSEWIISAADNIALVPGTSDPVTINTVNGGYHQGSIDATNPDYYVDNHDPDPLYSAMPPYASDAPVYRLQYDGFTTLLAAQSNIAANVIHHVKIAIADAPYDDPILDSAVFIKTQSFPCP